MTEAPNDRRTALLDGAVGYVLDHGLAALSLRPLAVELGTSDRMLLYHFGTKDDLVDAVLERANAQLLDRLAPALGTEGGLVERLWRALSATEVARYLRLFFEVYGLALQAPGRYDRFQRSVLDTWHATVTEFLRAQGDDPSPARVTVVVAGIEGLLLDLLITGDRARLDAAAVELAERLGV